MKIFPFATKSLELSKYPIADSTKNVFPNCCIKRNVEFYHLRTHIPKKFLRMLLSRFYMQIFPFPTKSLELSIYPLTDSTKRVFQNCSINRKFHLCYLSTYTTKKFQRILLSSFYGKIFLFSR